MNKKEDILVRAKKLLDQVENNRVAIEQQDAAYDQRKMRVCRNCLYYSEDSIYSRKDSYLHPIVQGVSLNKPKGSERNLVQQTKYQRGEGFFQNMPDSLCSHDGLLFEPVRTPHIRQRVKRFFRFVCRAVARGYPTSFLDSIDSLELTLTQGMFNDDNSTGHAWPNNARYLDGNPELSRSEGGGKALSSDLPHSNS
jgi:hypothetical protein